MDLPQLLIERGGVDSRRVEAALRRSLDDGSAFVQEVVRSGLLPEDTVAELAARALGTLLVAVEHGELDEEAVRLVPRRLAIRHVAVPVSRDESGERLRVAFADPFDAEAKEAFRRATGLEVEPLVSTVSSVLRAVERAYRGDTKVMQRTQGGARTDLLAETTQRVDRQIVDALATAPVHRVEDEANAEQRVEALLLALIDAGVISRADYVEALRRLLGHRGGTG
ncbi:MAG: hypothetical protein KF901_27175 [Myxococcales bacterium]|nr:hypothetical protein [Myxococcales bacterium]